MFADGEGGVYFADESNQRVRKVSGKGTVTTVAGNGTQGFSGDGGLATRAQLYNPSSVAVDGDKNVYIAEPSANRVRRVSPTGMIATVAGTGVAGFSGDGGPAILAQLYGPQGLTVDKNGNLYIADTGNSRIRKVSPLGVITTIAGGGTFVSLADNVPATSIQLGGPSSVTLDNAGNLYVADGLIHKIFPSGIIVALGGAGGYGYSGDGGTADSAQFGADSIGADSVGGIYVADLSNDAIRLLRPAGPKLTIIHSAATNRFGPIAPGEIVVITGSGLGPADLVSATPGGDGLYSSTFAGTTVQINGVSAPLLYTWTTQVAAIVPYSVSSGNAQVTVTYQNQKSDPISVPVAVVASEPGIFTLDSTGSGQAAAVNQDGSINSADHPAKLGDTIVLYATGEGQTTPAGVDGKPAAVPAPRPNLPVMVTIAGQTAQVSYAGGAPGEVAGLMQLNVQVPRGISAGSAVPLALRIGDAFSQFDVTIAVQ